MQSFYYPSARRRLASPERGGTAQPGRGYPFTGMDSCGSASTV